MHTIVAGGTNPLSWLKQPPYSTISTRSGYWSIESVAGKSAPKQEKDVHGMTKGHKPSAHRVPKIEDLLEQIKEQQTELLEVLQKADWDEAYKGSDSPLSPKVLASWGAGSKKAG